MVDFAALIGKTRLARRLHVDIETRSRVDLKKAGMYRYAQHESTAVMCFSYRFDHGAAARWREGQPMPREIVDHVANGGWFCAHNAQFERTVLNEHAGRAIGFPTISIDQCICTAAKAAAHGLPRNLKDAAKVLGTHPKNEDGVNDMRYLCKPRTDGTFCMPSDDPERYARLYAYCDDDVLAESEVDHAVPDLEPIQMKAYRLDQRINDRGIKVDLQMVEDVQMLIFEYKRYLAAECWRLIGCKPTQREKVAEWVRSQGYNIPDLQAATVVDAVADESCPEHVRKILRLYSTYGMKAVAKFPAAERATCDDGRLRGMYLYHAAHTGRWSALIVQLHNLFRPVIKDPDTAIAAFQERALDLIRFLYDKTDPMKVFASTVRGMLVPDDGKDFIVFDYSSIESRANAWFADEKAKLKIFTTHGKVYEAMASEMFGVPIDEIKKDWPLDHGQPLRFYGKIADLACYYGGGKNAFKKMAKQYGVKISDTDAQRYVDLARRIAPNIVKSWTEYEEAALYAVRNPGKVVYAMKRKVAFKVQGDYLYCRLPSGRKLAYYKPEVQPIGKFDNDVVTFLGINTYTRRWGRCTIWGGTWCENIIQAFCYDLLVEGLLDVEAAGFPVVGSTHDEGIWEVDEGTGDLEEIKRLFCQPRSWAPNFPIDAEGYRAKRYRK